MKSAKLLLAALVASLTLLVTGDQVGLAEPLRDPSVVWSPRIAIVWPHDGKGNPTSVDKSRAVNVSLWPEATDIVHCEGSPTELVPAREFLMAVDNEPAVPVPVTPTLVLRTVNGVTFQSLEYNNIPANLADNPGRKVSFVMRVGSYLDSAWVHAADSRTVYPEPLIPTGYSSTPNPALDTYIQVVWPHDASGQAAPVDQATLVNIAVDLFEHGTTQSVPPDYELPTIGVPKESVHLMLYGAKGNAPMLVIPGLNALHPEKVTYTAHGQTFPRWVFNNIPVEPGQQYHFAVLPNALTAAFPSIWTHASDSRTYLPAPELPAPCIP